eukprot:TRINITY_DN114283_c0_g1_i1.p1 TRINITY_DN114283_c0_g1~~TRINITY_DN114283_c0_g1_i1.p1  ORF type:complete len:260 (+),score=8.29 TRINITY_DN114283_c0_g1_i1:60-839(+)
MGRDRSTLEELVGSHGGPAKIQEVPNKGYGFVCQRAIKSGTIVLDCHTEVNGPTQPEMLRSGVKKMGRSKQLYTRILELAGGVADETDTAECSGENCSCHEMKIVVSPEERLQMAEQTLTSTGKKKSRPIDCHTIWRVECAIQANAFGEKADQPSCLCLRLSIFNHSCRPNCAVQLSKNYDRCTVRTLHAVAAGEELCISYLGYGNLLETMPFPTRQKLLRRFWTFTCACVRCEEERAAEPAEEAEASAGSPTVETTKQ